MSTPCNVHFLENGEIIANVYLHYDGGPDGEFGVLTDLENFFQAIKSDCREKRFDDPNFLAARFVVWQAAKRTQGLKHLDFLGIGICIEDMGDIDYIYQVNCDKNPLNKPTVTYSKVDR